MKRKCFEKILICLFFSLFFLDFVFYHAEADTKEKVSDAQSASKEISIETFIQLAAQNDIYFEEILIDQLYLKYRKNLNLPAKDLVLSVKGQYDFMFNQDREEPDATFSLSKLFPKVGTDVSASYSNTPSLTSTTSASEVSFLISQPIAQNAFGHSTRLYDKIIGLEIDVIEYQIVEAYEDYLASLNSLYCDWYYAYENLKVGDASYKENAKLLDNILEREKQKIALPIDVNKVRLLVAGKEKNLISLKDNYENITNTIKKAIGYEQADLINPKDPSDSQGLNIKFDQDYEKFKQLSRTYKILNLLEEKGGFEVKKEADDLLPSTNFLLGYKVKGDDWRIKRENNYLYAGISLEWPFFNQVDRAEYEYSKIDLKKRQLTNTNKYLELYVNLKNLYLEIQRENNLIALADETIKLAEAILEDESKNYSLGKITLNDYIDAVNKVDENRFNKILHMVELKKLTTEWLRLTDQLVTERVMKSYKANN